MSMVTEPNDQPWPFWMARASLLGAVGGVLFYLVALLIQQTTDRGREYNAYDVAFWSCMFGVAVFHVKLTEMRYKWQGVREGSYMALIAVNTLLKKHTNAQVTSVLITTTDGIFDPTKPVRFDNITGEKGHNTTSAVLSLTSNSSPVSESQNVEQ